MKTFLAVTISAMFLTACGDYAPWPEVGSIIPVEIDKTLVESTTDHNKFRLYRSGTTLFVTCDKAGRVVAIWSSQVNRK